MALSFRHDKKNRYFWLQCTKNSCYDYKVWQAKRFIRGSGMKVLIRWVMCQIMPGRFCLLYCSRNSKAQIII